MGSVKGLAKDTAIYGMSSIIGRFLNWCLVPLYTMMFPATEYGIVTLVYAVVALALIILTYGMETGFFRFANHERWHNPMQVYSTTLVSLACSGSMFIALVLIFLPGITRLMECQGHESYIAMMAICVAVDAFTALPFSYLRYRKRPIRFAILKLVNIGLNITLNLFFILLCPWLMKSAPSLVDWWYVEDFGIGYIFLSNLISSLATLLMMWPELHGFKWQFCGRLWTEMLKYSAPLLVLGVAGIMNQTIDKMLFPALYHAGDVMAQLGIYGANYKIAIIMVMFIQAFRYAYEPFIFAQNKQSGGHADAAYSSAMKWFLIAAFFIFMAVMFYLDILRYFISPKYFSGLKVVPIVMLAELMFGVFFNLSVWYKLNDKTIWGMWFSLIGLAITVVLNVILVPHYGYMGCAWAAFACYGTMMLSSYVIGQWKHPINYPLRQIGLYFIIAAVLYVIGEYLLVAQNHWVNWGIRAILLAIYLLTIIKIEKISFNSLLHPLKKAV